MALTIRVAGRDDERALVQLGAAIRGSRRGQGSITAATLAEGGITIAELDGAPVGYLCAERPLPTHVRVTDVGVLPAHRRQGVAAALLDRLVLESAESEAEGTTVTAVATLRQTAAAGLLLSRGFVGSRALHGGSRGEPHGAGQLQIHFQHRARVEYVDPSAGHLVALSDTAQLVESLAPGDHVVTALAELGGEPVFEISRFEQEDPASLQSGEAQAGIAFAGSVLAAITFLVGFSFASSRFPDDVRLLLIGATFATTMSLIIYASAAGELARIRSNAFGRIMKWGNVVSEYGGVLPFLVALPITYAQLAGAAWSAVALGAVLTIGLLWYERSSFSIASRFRHSFWTGLLTLLTSLAPLGSAVLAACHAPSWPWTLALVLALSGRTAVSLFRRGPESGISEFRRTSQLRRTAQVRR